MMATITADTVREAFKSTELNATDVARLAGLKPDLARRVLNRGGDSSLGNLKRLLLAIRGTDEMTGAGTSEETDAGNDVTGISAAPPGVQEDPATQAENDVTTHPDQNSNEEPEDTMRNAAGHEKVRHEPSLPDLDMILGTRSVAEDILAETLTGPKIDDHDLSPFAAFGVSQETERREPVLETADAPEDREVAPENADIAPVLTEQETPESEQRESAPFLVATTPVDIEALLGIAEDGDKDEEAISGEDDTAPADPAETVTESEVASAPVLPAQIDEPAQASEAEQPDTSIPTDTSAASSPVVATTNLRPAMRIEVGPVTNGAARVTLEADVPADKIDELIAFFMSAKRLS